MSAARALLVEQGPDAVLLGDVAQRAGVAVGTIYTRFRDKTELLREVHREEAEQMRRRSLEALDAAASSPDLIDEAVRAVVEAFFEHAPVMRQVLILAGNDEAIRAQGDEIAAPVATRFRDIVLAARVVQTKDGVEAACAADMCFELLFAACAHRITLGASTVSGRALDDSQFTAELVRMARLLLGAA